MTTNSKEYSAAYREVNKERLAAYNVAYREENKERVKEQAAAYYQEHKETIKARSSARYYADPESWNAKMKLWAQEHPERRKMYRRKHESARRARKRDAFIEDVDHAVVFDRDGGICQICDQAIENSEWHIDHIIPLVAGGAHSYANTQLTHAMCNMRKGARVVG